MVDVDKGIFGSIGLSLMVLLSIGGPALYIAEQVVRYEGDDTTVKNETGNNA